MTRRAGRTFRKQACSRVSRFVRFAWKQFRCRFWWKVRLLTNCRYNNLQCLMQPPKQLLVVVLGVDAVTVEAPQLRRNKPLILLSKHHGSKLRVSSSALIQCLGGNDALER